MGEQLADCFYRQTDLGAPKATNDPYYINWDGTSASGCGGTEYEYAYRQHGYMSSPVKLGDLPNSSGQPLSMDELYGNTALPPINTDYFGTDDARQATASNGLHVQNSIGGTWNLWTSSTVSGTYNRSDVPPTLHSMANYWSFRASTS